MEPVHWFLLRKKVFRQPFWFQEEVCSSVQYIGITWYIWRSSPVKENFDNMTITEIQSAINNAPNNIQRGSSFNGTEWIKKEVVTQSLKSS